MTLREFNKHLNACRTRDRRRLDFSKVALLSAETRHAMALFIVRNREPIHAAFLTPLMDQSWLNAMGYLYQQTTPNGTFRHTCEHRIR